MLKVFKKIFFSSKKKDLETFSQSLPEHLKLGKKGEEYAINYLKQQGYSIREVNWHAHPHEIDIICEHHESIIFVEVKSRSYNSQEHALAAFHSKKQKNCLQAAQKYISFHNLWHRPIQFDFICITGTDKKVEHFQNVIEYRNDSYAKNRNSAHSGDTSWQPW